MEIMSAESELGKEKVKRSKSSVKIRGGSVMHVQWRLIAAEKVTK